MRVLIRAAAFLVGFGDLANASVLSYKAIFSDFQDRDGVLAAIGADPDASDLVFSWTLDADPVALEGPKHFNTSQFELDTIALQYRTFDVTVGGVTLFGAPSITSADRIIINDWVVERTLPTSDYFEVASFSNQDGPNGNIIYEIYLYALSSSASAFGRAPGDPIFSGLVHPSLSQLNELSLVEGIFSIRKANGDYAFISGNSSSPGTAFEFIEVSTVPLPGGILFMLSGLALFYANKQWTRLGRPSDRTSGTSKRTDRICLDSSMIRAGCPASSPAGADFGLLRKSES